jgi:hypothetical protein
MMPDLIEQCLDFIKDNIYEIVEKSEAIPTYKSHIAKKLARKISIEILDKVNDPRDVLLSRLYKKKLEIFFEEPENLLMKCMICDELYTKAEQIYLVCKDPESVSFIRYDGKIGCDHIPDPKWDLNEFVMLL